MTPLVIASHNEGKVGEIRELLSSMQVTVVSAVALGLPSPDENGKSFSENATIKSVSAAQLSGHYALADDSGLCVQALDGAPGIHSARWIGAGKDSTVGIERIRRELAAKGVEPNGADASFVCVLAFTAPDGKTETFEGTVHGTLAFPPRGKKGFGYDPIFIPDGYKETFGEMEPAAKHSLSHRARAFEKFSVHIKAQAVKAFL